MTGEQAIKLARFSFRLVDSRHNNGDTTTDQKTKSLVPYKLCQILRDICSIFNKLKVNQSELILLKKLRKLFHNIHSVFLGGESLANSVWTVAHAILFVAQKLYDKYKVGKAYFLCKVRNQTMTVLSKVLLTPMVNA